MQIKLIVCFKTKQEQENIARKICSYGYETNKYFIHIFTALYNVHN